MAEEIGRRRTKSIEQEVPGAGDESPSELQGVNTTI